jgi:molybdate transport system substrate-binding protein
VKGRKGEGRSGTGLPVGRIAALLAVAAALATAACGDGSSATDGSGTATAGGTRSTSGDGPVHGSITVLAAASLKESFTAIGKAFETADPGAAVTFSFGASSALARQVTQGAPADVFASASQKNMQQVVESGDASDPAVFARNVLEIAVPEDNPADVRRLQDLARPGVKVALCQPQVPCGELAQKVLAKANVQVKPATLEADVKATLTKVQLGEVDAGLVYVTDVKAAGGKVTGVPIPADVTMATTYPIAALSGSENPALARAFVRYVLSGAARAELAQAGFEAP